MKLRMLSWCCRNFNFDSHFVACSAFEILSNKYCPKRALADLP